APGPALPTRAAARSATARPPCGCPAQDRPIRQQSQGRATKPGVPRPPPAPSPPPPASTPAMTQVGPVPTPAPRRPPQAVWCPSPPPRSAARWRPGRRRRGRHRRLNARLDDETPRDRGNAGPACPLRRTSLAQGSTFSLAVGARLGAAPLVHVGAV